MSSKGFANAATARAAAKFSSQEQLTPPREDEILKSALRAPKASKYPHFQQREPVFRSWPPDVVPAAQPLVVPEVKLPELMTAGR